MLIPFLRKDSLLAIKRSKDVLGVQGQSPDVAHDGGAVAAVPLLAQRLPPEATGPQSVEPRLPRQGEVVVAGQKLTGQQHQHGWRGGAGSTCLKHFTGYSRDDWSSMVLLFPDEVGELAHALPRPVLGVELQLGGLQYNVSPGLAGRHHRLLTALLQTAGQLEAGRGGAEGGADRAQCLAPPRQPTDCAPRLRPALPAVVV